MNQKEKEKFWVRLSNRKCLLFGNNAIKQLENN